MSTTTYLVLILYVQLACVLASVPLRCFIGDDRSIKELGKAMLEQSLEIPQKKQPELGNFFLKDYVVNQDGLLFQSKAVEVVGIENAAVNDFGMNLKSNLTRITFNTDLLMKGPYKVGGSLFSIPIEGEGDFEINYKNVQFDMILPFEIIQDESGKRFMNLKSYQYRYDVKDGSFRLNNLYGGNKELSDGMNYFINQNWKLVTLLYAKMQWIK